MIQTKNDCPEKNELIDYLLGRLSPELLSRYESHFEDCQTCEETIRGLGAADTLSQLVGQAVTSDEQSAETDQRFVSGLINRLQTETANHKPIDPTLAERSAEVLRLLAANGEPQSLGQLGIYRIDEILGAGSTGVVFRATDTQLDRPVALKILRPSLGEAARQRFLTEARAAASIDHPNVVTIYQVAEEDEFAFIAMQWLPGETLEQRLNQVTYIPEKQNCEIAKQIAAGLQAAHDKNLIHRDIKPANIWLSNESDQVKILDFGLARIADDDPHLTSTGMLAGTPNFMSPEQSKGMELDGRSDLFSLGCLMYRTSTGKLPFGAGNILATLQAIQNHSPNPPEQLNPAVSSNFSDLVMCLLEKHPANRPESADQLIRALNESRKNWPFVATANQPTSAMAVQRGDRQKTQPGRIRWIAAAIALGLAAWGCYAFGPQIIRIATDHGELVIETDEDDVQVEILSDGKVVKVIDTWSEQTIDLKSGEYQVRSKNKSGEDVEFKSSKEKFVISRGGKQVISISIVANNDSNTPIRNASDISIEPLYEGITFSGWVDKLEREHSPDVISSAITALGAIVGQAPERQDQAIQAATRAVRLLGSRSRTKDNSFVESFNAFIVNLEPEKIVDFMAREIEHGTRASRQQLTWLSSTSTYPSEHNFELHRKLLREKLPQILTAGIEQIKKHKSAAGNHVIRIAMGGMILFSHENVRNRQIEPVLVSFLERELASSSDAEVSAFLSAGLVGQRVESKLAVSKFLELLLEPKVPDEMAYEMHTSYLNRIPNHDFDQVFETLRIIYDNIEPHGRLFGYRRTLPGGTRSGTRFAGAGFENSRNVAGGNRVVHGIGGGGGGGALSRAGTNKLSPDDYRRIKVILGIASRGKSASIALPWLDELAKGDSPQKQAAANAAREIRKAAFPAIEARAFNHDAVTNKSSNVEKEEGSSTATNNAANSNEPLQKGKTFDEWLNLLQREKDESTIATGIKALGFLSEDNPEKQREAIDAITPLIRKQNWFTNTDAGFYWYDVFLQFFSHIPPEQIIRFVIEEIEHGTLQSRRGLVWFVLVGSVYEDQEKPQQLHREALKKNFRRVLVASLTQLKKNESKDDNRAIREMVSILFRTCQQTRKQTKTAHKIGIRTENLKLDPELTALLNSELEQDSNIEVRAMIAVRLLEYGSNSELVIQTISNALIKPDLPVDMTFELYSGLGRLKNEDFNNVIEPLIAIFEDEHLCGRLTGQGFANGNGNHGTFVATDPKDLKRIRTGMIRMIGKRSQHASAALPWLDKITKSDSQQKQVAAETAATIRAAIAINDGEPKTESID